jgi:hypothetical protein
MFGRYCCALQYTFESTLRNDPDLTQPRGLYVEGIIEDKCGKETVYILCTLLSCQSSGKCCYVAWYVVPSTKIVVEPVCPTAHHVLEDCDLDNNCCVNFRSCFFVDELEEAIKRDFGSLDNLKAQLSAISVGIQGSGWGWLGYNKQAKKLQLAACANQDPLEGTTGQFLKQCLCTLPTYCKLRGLRLHIISLYWVQKLNTNFYNLGMRVLSLLVMG